MRKLRFAVLAPSHITAADEDECSRYADKEAFSRRTRVESASGPAIVFGPIGAIVQLTQN
jgi:hypothetical protein